MPLVVPITPTNLPNPPSTESPDDFDARADAFLGALPNNQSELNQLSQAAYTNAAYSNEQATSAAASASTAAGSATTAGVYASQAINAANNVSTKWVSGTTYTEGAQVWSPLNFQTYRRKSTGAGTTDPANDNDTVWARIYAAFEPIEVPGSTVSVVPFARYILTNTASGTDITLPANPKLGDTIYLDNNTGRSDVWIRRNTKKIMGLDEDSQFDLQASISLYYAGTTYGWRIQ